MLRILIVLLFFSLTLFNTISYSSGLAMININPVQIELFPTLDQAVLRIKNNGPTAVIFQSRIVNWLQENSKDRYTSSHEIIVSPLIFSIPSQHTQIIRLKFTGVFPTSQQKNYRLFFRQILPANNDSITDATQIKMALNVGIPLWVNTGHKTVSQVAIHAHKVADVIKVSVVNQGNEHILLTQALFCDNKRRTIENRNLFQYALASNTVTITLNNSPSKTKFIKLVINGKPVTQIVE